MPPDPVSPGDERKRRFWWAVWRFYDSDWGRVLPHSLAPWLLGKALGAKGERVDDASR